MPWDNTPPDIAIPEWGVVLVYSGSYADDCEVETFVGDLDLGVTGWLPARIMLERGDGDVRYSIACGPRRAIEVETEWCSPGEHIDGALRELCDLLEEMPRVANAIRAIEASITERREREAINERYARGEV